MQALRALAALMVVATHSRSYAQERLGAPVFWPMGARGVDIFFVISGFVMAVSSRRLEGQSTAWRTFE